MIPFPALPSGLTRWVVWEGLIKQIKEDRGNFWVLGRISSRGVPQRPELHQAGSSHSFIVTLELNLLAK